MTSAVVVWDEADFLAFYPRFVGKFTPEQFAALWETACTLVDNTPDSPLPCDPGNGVHVRKIALYALVCHLATMSLWEAGQAGPVSSATEGSVSASFRLPELPGGGAAAQWYHQTPCGRTAWMFLRKWSLGGRYYDVRRHHPYG